MHQFWVLAFHPLLVLGKKLLVLRDFFPHFKWYFRILGLDVCADTLVGNDMLRGISGGQMKRVTIGEMLAGAAKALFMDEISIGLDSSTTFQIVNALRQTIHILQGTAVISLLQPALETCDLFNEIILISDGQIVYQGPRENVLEFFGLMGFQCPDRKGVADFFAKLGDLKERSEIVFEDDKSKSHHATLTMKKFGV
ncbi:hypothetical protein IFM89_022287 [Coptis chinensis]|uniref:ABC transporter family G domain-containing protein n=1 Tax=Coptis chinensis TaxID=261450 RepID=A0A835IA86_9MAGN|nr:hypothetical protein IFM89_022287 [Coptis chinensis]